MNFRLLVVVEMLLALIGGFSMQAYGASCRAAQRIQINYWKDRNTGHPAAAADLKRQNEWAFRGGCGGSDMYSYGDYDHDRHWHDSDWWVGHDRGWVQQRHPTWVAAPEHHDNDRGHDHGEGNGHHDNH